MKRAQRPGKVAKGSTFKSWPPWPSWPPLIAATPKTGRKFCFKSPRMRVDVLESFLSRDATVSERSAPVTPPFCAERRSRRIRGPRRPRGPTFEGGPLGLLPLPQRSFHPVPVKLGNFRFPTTRSFPWLLKQLLISTFSIGTTDLTYFSSMVFGAELRRLEFLHNPMKSRVCNNQKPPCFTLISICSPW